MNGQNLVQGRTSSVERIAQSPNLGRTLGRTGDKKIKRETIVIRKKMDSTRYFLPWKDLLSREWNRMDLPGVT